MPNMELSRRNFLGTGLASLAAPAIIRTPGLIMPIRPLLVPAQVNWTLQSRRKLPGLQGWERLVVSKETIQADGSSSILMQEIHEKHIPDCVPPKELWERYGFQAKSNQRLRRV
jgi:hypothetical protein